MNLLIYGVNGDGEGSGCMGRLIDGLIVRYMDRLVDGDDSIDVEINGYLYGV